MGSQHAPRESPNGPNEMLFNMPRISDFQFALLLFFHRHQQRLRRIFFGAPRSIRRSDDDAQDTVIGPRLTRPCESKGFDKSRLLVAAGSSRARIR